MSLKSGLVKVSHVIKQIRLVLFRL